MKYAIPNNEVNENTIVIILPHWTEFFLCLEVVTSGRVTAWRRHESVATRATVVRRRRSFVTKRGGVAEVLVWKKERGSQFSWCELEQKRKNWGESWTERCKTYGETSASVCTLSLLLLYLSAYERETRFSELNAKSWQRISSILSLTTPIFFFFFFAYILFLFLSCSILYSYISVCHSKFTKSKSVIIGFLWWYHGIARFNWQRRKFVHETI